MRHSFGLKVLLQLLVLFAAIAPAAAIDPSEYAVQVFVQAQASPPALVLRWPPNSGTLNYKVYRKSAGEVVWGSPIATLPANATQFTDNAIQSGDAYEYQVLRAATWGTASGYAYGGINVPAPDYRGGALLLVDAAVSGALDAELAQFTSDLIGDGWSVHRRDVSRTATPVSVKSVILDAVSSSGGEIQALIIVGHIPVPYSGDINPDMHADHKGAWPADTFYATFDPSWPDTAVNNTSAITSANHNVPGDGKFDPSTLPSPASLIVGRIDFHNLPSLGDEVTLLRRYFQKNHAYRHRMWAANPRGLLYDGFGDIAGDAPAADAWRNLPALFGPGNFDLIGPGQFFGAASANSYAMAFASGGGSFNQMNGVGTSAQFGENDPKTPFLFLNGSYFGDWNTPDNFLRAAIASPSYTLVSGWAGLPHWYLHFMGLGEIVGYGFRASQNNAGTYHSHLNPGALQVHTALLGDPTLRLHTVMPPAGLAVFEASGALRLTWNPSPDASGYLVYASASPTGPFGRVTAQPIMQTEVELPLDSAGSWLMVRAVKSETTGSGSYANLSQGVSIETVGGNAPLPVISFQQSSASASELGPTAATITLQRTGSPAEPLEVLYSVQGSATPGDDFQALPGRVTFQTGSATATISILPRADTTIEGAESVHIELVALGEYTLAAPSVAIVTIEDAPNQPPIITAIAAQHLTEDSASTFSFGISDPDTALDSLSVNVTSENPSLLNASLSGSGAERIVHLTPAANASGSTFVRVAVSDGMITTTQRVSVAIAPVNDPPILNPLSDIRLQENDPSLTLVLAVSDVDTPISTLSVTAASDNGALFPPSSLVTSFATGQWRLAITPARNQHGAAAITVSVTDGSSQVTQQFAALVEPVFHPPQVNPIDPQTLLEDQATAPIALTITDADTPLPNLAVSATAGAPLFERLEVIWTGIRWELLATPASNAHGATTINLTVEDGIHRVEQSISVTISPVPDSPTLDLIAPVILMEDSAPHTVLLPVGDVDTPLAQLSVAATFSGDPILTTADLQPRFENGTWRLNLRPAPNANGRAVVTITATDMETPSVPQQFEVTVTAVDDPPGINPINDIVVNEDSGLLPLPLFISDPDSGLGTLSVIAVSSDPLLLERLATSWNGNNWQLLLQPRANAAGAATITVRVSDTASHAEVTFRLTILEVPDQPTIQTPQRLIILEDSFTRAPVAIDDSDTPLPQINVSAHSTNIALFPAGSLSTVFTNLAWALELRPARDAHGEDSITITVGDGSSEVATSFKVTVESEPDAPVIHAIAPIDINEDAPPTIVPIAVSDSDTPANAIIVSASVVPAGLASASVERTQTAWRAIVAPAGNAFGIGELVVVASDSDNSVTNRVRFTINSVDDPPALDAPSQVTGRANAPLTFPVRLSDVDTVPANLALRASALTASAFQSVAVSPLGGSDWQVTLTPMTGFSGIAQVQLTASDETSSREMLVAVEFTALNGPPTATDDNLQTHAGQRLRVPFAQLLANDFDPESDPLNVVEIEAVSQNGGSVRIEKDAVVFDPNAGFRGLFGFKYHIEDPAGLRASAMAFIDVISPPSMTASISNNTIVIRVSGARGEEYIVQRSNEFGGWERAGAVVIDDSGAAEWSQPVAGARQFFRLESQ